jgi:radical SAM family uncharacterized protein/radical SAM-linked protein
LVVALDLLIDRDRLLEQILPCVEKPGRYIGNEFNVQRKNWQKVQAAIVLAFPDLYDLGMSYYGFQILYHCLNREPDIVAERVYAPWPDFEKQLRQHRIPLYALESRHPLSDFDVVGFSLTFELGYTNVLNMLDLAGISLRACNRQKADPYVIAGGGACYNPEPVAAFFDCFIIGDAEEILPDIVRCLADGRRKERPRREVLRELALRFEGVYVPELYTYHPEDSVAHPLNPAVPERIKALRVTELLPTYYPDRPLIPLIEITQDRLVVEIMRGCTRGCRFCQAGMIYRPVRERSVDDLTGQIERSLSGNGHPDISLLSLSSSDYQGLRAVVEQTEQKMQAAQLSWAFPSLRLNSFSESLARIASRGHKSGLTFAPEAGSQRLRNVINKNITEEELFQAVEIALRNGWRLLKLYFMVGLPTETQDDLQAIVDLSARLQSVSQRCLMLNVTLSTFIPKPFTPFQWEPQDAVDTVQAKLDFIKPLLKQQKHIKVMARDPRTSRLEGIMSRGDRHLADAIEAAWQAGARFDAWKDCFNADLWDQVFKEQKIVTDNYLNAREIDKYLPWELIDGRISRDFLLEERQKAYRGESTPDCRLGCTGCGVCEPRGLAMQIKTLGSNKTEDTEAQDSGAELAKDFYRYRLQYEKKAPVRFTSHLDVIRIFQRVLQGSGLRLVYTQGYHRKPKISAGFPLPFGYTSVAEYMDVTLMSPAEHLKEQLNAYLPNGFRLISAELISAQKCALFTSVVGFEYRVDFERELPSTLQSQVLQVLQVQSLLIERCNKAGQRQLDIRPYIQSIKVNQKLLKLHLKVFQGKTVRMDEILRLLQLDEYYYQAHRVKTFML